MLRKLTKKTCLLDCLCAAESGSKMPCYGPLTAYYTVPDKVTGKRGITFARNASQSGKGFQVPCGRCIGCRLEKSRQWAVRCMHENKMHTHSQFVTLTYSNEWLPLGGTLVKRDLQLFMKRLRKKKGEGIRFYACGEYGDFNARPHYHAILFNCDFPDKRFHTKNGRGEELYTSSELSEVWPFGHHLIGNVTFDSAAYVARYVVKKITGKPADDHYSVVDADGRIYERLPEFALMSRRPGIGFAYYEKYGSEVRTHDNVIVNGKESPSTRYYNTRGELHDPSAYAKLRRQRKREALLRKADNTSRRRWVKETIAIARFKKLERKV